jgi:hypothetical protein
VTLDPGTIQILITFVVGGGLATLIAQLVRAFGSFRSGARASTREVVKDLAAARDEAEDRLSDMRRDKDYWRNVAADYAYQLRQKGVSPVPPEPMSPSERAREIGRREESGSIFRGAARASRAAQAPSTEEIDEVYDGDDARQ